MYYFIGGTASTSPKTHLFTAPRERAHQTAPNTITHEHICSDKSNYLELSGGRVWFFFCCCMLRIFSCVHRQTIYWAPGKGGRECLGSQNVMYRYWLRGFIVRTTAPSNDIHTSSSTHTNPPKLTLVRKRTHTHT